MFDKISSFVWDVVGLGISIAIAFMILQIFLPDKFLSWMVRLCDKKTYIKCNKCKAKNSEENKFCLNCGQEL